MAATDNVAATLFFHILTLTKSARVTLPAAFFIHHGGFAALGTQVADLHCRAMRDGELYFLFNGVPAVAISV